MKTIKNLIDRKTEIIVLLVLVFEFTFPHYSLAVEPSQSSVLLPDFIIKSAEELVTGEIIRLITPIREPEPTVIQTYKITVTAYSSTVDQTDSTPCITANGFDLCEHNQEDVIAANFLPFGTKVRIPEYFGDRVFTVQDRMNQRYYYRADVWMKTREAAKQFGAPYTIIEVIE
ncbi:MAG: hypothetical protein A2731_00445 [Candidatus Buchananbacteria bacterium RIFCSPHIGHO2_01_FULL_39_8]|uniref:3D domain-containing protein n=1 Tax=Candidatus Buchananbacteria bacterium RIFCSPHIGHO2_01_FULL_39_8 TaxID=1797533 RepID=A0A1G1XTN1_9BACT|nr:MAG: hypothetical protein A2731_00445 [Candidatus Buchananbacteria bacterium RIFCSPHIGHO2_01_FULL_39_8]